jgi:hypothetical protein
MTDGNLHALGEAIAGSLIATATFRALIEKGVLTGEEGVGIVNRASVAVSDSIRAEERIAFIILEDLKRQLQS